MRRVLTAVAAMLLISGSAALAETKAPAPAPTTAAAPAAQAVKPSATPTTVDTCIAMVKGIGPAVTAAKLTPPEMAELQIKGATVASLCHQNKYKEAVDLHTQIAAELAAKKK